MSYSVSLAYLLTRINRTAITVAIAIVFLTILVGSFVLGLMGTVENAHVQARVLAENSFAAILFEDRRAANELLGSLRHSPQVEAAQLYGADGRLLARYVRAAAPGSQDDRGFPLGMLNVRQEVANEDGRIGSITMTIGLAGLYRQTAWLALITLIAASAATLVSSLLLRRLDRSVLRPLQALNHLMAKVHGQSDFSVRARASQIAEIDALGRGFNEMIEKVQDRDRRLAQLAFSDKLTGLPNRSAFLERLERELQRAAREGHRLGLLFLDLDGFKQVNDTMGHEIGDQLLVEAAARIGEALRPSDASARLPGAANDSGAARLGGDEFTVVLPDLREAADVLVVARRIGESMRRPFLIGGCPLKVTASIGAAVYPDHGGDSRTLLRHADTAMYHSKRSGRDHSCLYSAQLAEQVQERADAVTPPHRTSPGAAAGR